MYPGDEGCYNTFLLPLPVLNLVAENNRNLFFYISGSQNSKISTKGPNQGVDKTAFLLEVLG